MIKFSAKAKYSFKIIVVGNGNAGKTCLVNRFCYDKFSMDTSMTIGVNFNAITIQATKGKEPIQIDCILWDLGGQGKFYNLLPYFSEGANGIIYAFDLSNSQRQGLEDLVTKWRPMIISHIKESIPSILVGTKADVIDGNEDIYTPETLKTYQKELEAVGYIETSAKENKNIKTPFIDIVQAIVNKPIFRSYNIKVLDRMIQEDEDGKKGK